MADWPLWIENMVEFFVNHLNLSKGFIRPNFINFDFVKGASHLVDE